MTERKIIPVRVLELQVEDDEVLRRGTADRHAPTRYKNSPKNTCVRVLDDQGSLHNDDGNGSESVTGQKVNSCCLKLNCSFSNSLICQMFP